MSKRLLLISYAFAPLSAPEAILNSKLPDLLPGYEVDVVTISHEKLGLQLDSSLDNTTERKFGKIHRVNPPFWCTPAIFKLLRRFPLFPDRYRLFNKRIFKRALDLEIHKYDVIMTWSQWHSVHSVGLSLKEYNPNIFWVAHLSDPWSCNPFLPSSSIFKKCQKFFEEKTFKNADQIHFTSAETLRVSLSGYDQAVISKAFTVPHAFSKRLVKSQSKKMEGRNIKVRYTGNFYGERNPIALIKAFQSLMQQDIEILKNVQIEFFGAWLDVKNPSSYISSEYREKIRFRKTVNYKSSLKVMSEADLLLLIDAPSSESIFFPSKLVDYMSVERPIIAITPEGTTKNIVRSIGGFVISENSEELVGRGFLEAIKRYKAGLLNPPDKNKTKLYEAEQVSKIYLTLFDSK